MNNKDEHKHIYIKKIKDIIKDWYVHTMEIISQCQQKLEWNTMDLSVRILIHTHFFNEHDPFPVRSIEKRNILKKEMIPTILIYKSYIENLHHLDYIVFIIREWSNDKCSFNQVLTLLVWKHYESLEKIDKNRKNLDTIKKKISGSPFIFDQLVLGVTEAFFSPETFQTYDPAVKAQLTIVTDTYQQNNQLLIEAFNYYRLADKTACDVADPNPSSDGEDYKYKSELKRISINASCVELFDSMVSLHPNFRGDRTYLGNIDEVLSSASKSDLINIEKLQKKGDEKGNVINETDRKYKIILKNNVVVFNDLEKTKEKNRTKNLKKKQRRKRRNQESAILAQTSNNRALNDNISGSAYSLLDRPPEPHIANIAPASADDVCTPNSAQPMHSPSSSTETNDANLPNHMSNTVFEEPVETKGVCAPDCTQPMHPPSSAPEIADGNIPIHTINTVCEEPEAESIYLPTTVPWDHGVSPEEKNRWQSKLNKGNTEPIPPITVVQSIINSRPLYSLPASHWDTLRKMHDPLECIKVRYSQLKTIWIYINRENSVDDHRGSSHFRLNDSNGNYIGSSFKHGKNFNYVYSTIRQWHDAFAKIGITKEEIDKYYGKSQSGPVLK